MTGRDNSPEQMEFFSYLGNTRYLLKMNHTTTEQATRQGGRAAIIFLGLALVSSTIYVRHHALLWQTHPFVYGIAMLSIIRFTFALGRQVGVRILIEGEKPLLMGIGTAFCVLVIYSAIDSLCLLLDLPPSQYVFVDLFAQTFLIGLLPFGAMGLVLGMHLHLTRS